MSDSHLPCHVHAMPFFSRPRHGTARLSREGLWATCPRSASSGYHAEFHEVVNRSIQISDAGGQYETKKVSHGRGKEWQHNTKRKKKICLSVALAVRIFPATMRNFTKDKALSEHGRGAA